MPLWMCFPTGRVSRRCTTLKQHITLSPGVTLDAKECVGACPLPAFCAPGALLETRLGRKKLVQIGWNGIHWEGVGRRC